jgi:hypothetical protein
MLFHLNADAAEPDFRQNNWGDTREQVLLAEGEPIKRDGETWRYDVRIGDVQGSVIFRFLEGKLTNAFYVFFAESMSNQDQFLDFFRISDGLVKRYGKPTKEAAHVDPSLIRDGSDSLKAIASEIGAGRATWYEQWDTPKTIVIHSLKGDNNFAMHQVLYWSKAHTAEQDRARTRGSPSGL